MSSLAFMILFASCVIVIYGQFEGYIGRPRRPNCAAVLCLRASCSNPVTPEGQCCPECTGRPSICARVRCAIPTSCSDTYIPDGWCCPICRPGRPYICDRVRCARPTGCADTYVPRGQCCPVCVPGNECHLVDCRPLRCRPRRQYVPDGECCPVCRRSGRRRPTRLQ